MFTHTENGRPRGLIEVKSLIIDRKYSNGCEPPVICLDLDNTLICLINKPLTPLSNESHINHAWLERGIDVTFNDAGEEKHFLILPRPGLTELIAQLYRHAGVCIYTDLTESHIDKIMLALSRALDPDAPDPTEEIMEAAYAYMELPLWSIEECIQAEEGYKKALGAFTEYTDANIDNLWMITNKPELVDYPNRAVTVPSYYGDPDDRALFQLIEEVFIN